MSKNVFSGTRLQCQCVFQLIPRIEKHLAVLKADTPLKVQIAALQTAIHELKRSAAEHQEFQLEYARAMAEQDKRLVGENLQTTAYKMGRKRTEEEQASEDRRQQAIEMGRIKKRSRK